MGMFDWINYEAACPKCGEINSGFQSKDGHCTLATLEPWEVENFYSSCKKCKTWIEARVEKTTKPVIIAPEFKVYLRCDDKKFYVQKKL